MTHDLVILPREAPDVDGYNADWQKRTTNAPAARSILLTVTDDTDGTYQPADVATQLRRLADRIERETAE